MKHLTKDELRALLTVAKKHDEQHWLMILVAYWHGMRASEVCALTGRDIRDGEIVVRRLKGSLTTVQPLMFSEDPLFMERVHLEKLNSVDRLFNIDRKKFWALLQAYGQEAGIPRSKCHPHILKHTIAMHSIAKAGIENLRTYLGHKNMNSTGAYLKVDDETASKAIAAAVGM